MKKSTKITLVLMAVFLLMSRNCFAYWVWSPETGKWINPVYRTFDDPKEQFDWAKGYFDEKDYKKATFEFKKVLKKFPKSKFAPEAKYYIAFCQEKMKKHYPAFTTYQSVIELYPLNERLDEIVERQYLIGEIYFKKKNYELAKRIFEKVLQNAPYSKVSDVVQYKIGLCLLRMRRFSDAHDEFENIPENYSFSPYLDDASFNAALCSFKISSIVHDYDLGLIDKAVDDLEYFLRRFQTSQYVPKAESLLNKLYYKKAEKLFKVAQFYEKRKKKFAALKYYEEVMYSYEKTYWAQRATKKLKKLRD